jgi:glycosyltransferase involved in cell wall biosynthesis
MIGDGPLLSECKDLAKQAGILVEFTGNSDDISRELESIDIVAVSSLKDAFNMVVVEAMARGVPVAAYPVGGIPEIINDNETGLLSEAVGPEALAHSIERILFEEGLYKKLSANAFSHAGERYGLHAYRKKWEDILFSVECCFTKAKT